MKTTTIKELEKEAEIHPLKLWEVHLRMVLVKYSLTFYYFKDNKLILKYGFEKSTKDSFSNAVW